MTLSLIQQPPALVMSEQPVAFILQSDATGTPLRITAGVMGVNGSDSIAADAQKKASFEVSDYLQGLITLRGKTDATPSIYSGVPKYVEIVFYEMIGNPPVYGADYIHQCLVLDGRVPKSFSKAFYAAHTNLLLYLVSSKSALSWWPVAETKKVLADQKEFINIIQLASQSAITLTLKLLLTFTDGITAENTAFTVSNVMYMQIVYFPTGYTQLGIGLIMAQAYPEKTLAGYSVYVKNGATLISEVYKYTVDNTWCQHPRVLYIRNSFGLWEVVLCTGLGEQTNEIKPEMAVTDGQSLPDKLNWKTTKTDIVKANTGYLSAACMQWLSDLDFREAYEMIDGNLHPIVFRDLKLPVVHDGVYQYSADLEYEYAFIEKTEVSS